MGEEYGVALGELDFIDNIERSGYTEVIILSRCVDALYRVSPEIVLCVPGCVGWSVVDEDVGEALPPRSGRVRPCGSRADSYSSIWPGSRPTWTLCRIVLQTINRLHCQRSFLTICR